MCSTRFSTPLILVVRYAILRVPTGLGDDFQKRRDSHYTYSALSKYSPLYTHCLQLCDETLTDLRLPSNTRQQCVKLTSVTARAATNFRLRNFSTCYSSKEYRNCQRHYPFPEHGGLLLPQIRKCATASLPNYIFVLRRTYVSTTRGSPSAQPIQSFSAKEE